MKIKRINQLPLINQGFYEILIPILFIIIGLLAAFNHALW